MQPASQQTVDVQPVPQPTFDEMMKEWFELCEQIKPIKETLKPLLEAEQKLRANIVALAFKPESEKAFLEGTHYKELGNGWRLKGELKIERKVIEDLLSEQTKAMLLSSGINLDTLLRIKHEVNVKSMRQLTAEQQKLFDTILVITQPMAVIELVPPK